ncbi:uncharacterized protein SRS1_15562 [Sporisorium reilianum f. sp. reilianum]|uniref:BRCT domain-containing protein n=1 Tax=Sporisorium reilianum f. sp. reilianum TaxID=72559 RepID=A0A2N8UIG9_9BASI|nr:uncharacterized protein SRS1_15562 [Sporisorium reilianum f. sp. reilianum]
MNASQESNEFVEPAPRPPRSDPSAVASTSRVTLSTTAATATRTRIELLSDDAPSDSPPGSGDDEAEPSIAKRPSSSKAKVFLKSTSPDVSLHIHLPRELDHTLARKLQIAIRAHGGFIETVFGKADLIVVDPKLVTVARKALKHASQIGQPIPVVTFDYINDCVAQGAQLDVNDAKYKYQPTQSAAAELANLPAPAPRSLNGRNPFTDADRQAIVSYFVDKDEASWSLSAAARELAARIPTHTYQSFQSYLQANFEKGWNLKRDVLTARRNALDGEPSELQARILRSQYTPEPGPSEQSAPSDGWPRASPRARAQAGADDEPEHASSHSSQQEEEEPDLQVRQPNPGATIDNVEKSPTKIRQPVDNTSPESSDAGTSPPPSISPEQRIPPSGAMHAATSDDEEPDPDEYSPSMMRHLLRPPSPSRLAALQKSRSKSQPAAQDSDSSDDSELDQLDDDSDEDLLETGPPNNPSRAEQSEDPEWQGSRRLDSKMRQANSQANSADKRVKFTQDEKDALLNQLVDHVMAKGSDLPPATQDAIIAKPEDVFWEQFATVHSKHSAASWRSHYLKNRSVYKQMIDLMILDRVTGQAEDDDDDDEVSSYVGSAGEGEGQDDLAIEQQTDEQLPDAAPATSSRASEPDTEDTSEQLGSKPNGTSQEEDISAFSDGVVVLLPPLDFEPPARRQPSSDEQWPDAPPPPPMHDDDDLDDDDDDEEDMMQVEAEIEPSTDASQSACTSPEEESSTGSVAYEVDSVDGDAESIEQVANDESAGSSWRPSVEPSIRPQRNAAPVAHRRSTSAVQAGSPVLAQHRDAPFYDFTMDSDEEQRIRIRSKPRSRPSLPNLQSRRQGVSPRLHRSPITTDRVLGHFATPSRNQRPAATRHDEDDRFERTRTWARSVSRSASPIPMPAVESVAITESSRSRASRIHRGPMLRSPFVDQETPSRRFDNTLSSRRISGGGRTSAVPPALVSPTPMRTRANPVDVSLEKRASRSAKHAARMRYRRSVAQFLDEFALENQQARELLNRFGGDAIKARAYLLGWLKDMRQAYGVEGHVAFEYVKTSQGDFEQAETFLRLASMTRSSSTPSRSFGNVSRSMTNSASPRKRRGDDEQRSLAHPESSRRRLG